MEVMQIRGNTGFFLDGEGVHSHVLELHANLWLESLQWSVLDQVGLVVLSDYRAD